MKKLIFGFLIGFVLGSWIISAMAKYESTSNDAASVVLYGSDGTNIKQIQVNSLGELRLK